MRLLDAVLQDASGMLGQVGALLERCRALRLELDAERTPTPDVTACGIGSWAPGALCHLWHRLLGSWGGQRPNLGDHVMGTGTPDGAPAAGGR